MKYYGRIRIIIKNNNHFNNNVFSAEKGENMLKKENTDFHNMNHEILMAGDDFAYVLPSKKLRPWISNYTITFPNDTMLSDNYTVVPHGSATLVFYINTKGIHSRLFGPSTIPQTVGKIANECSTILIIEFQPAGLFAFTSTKQEELMDAILPFGTINSILDQSLKKIFNQAKTADALLLTLEKELENNLLADYPVELSEAIQLVIQHLGNVPPNVVASKVHYSERHLNRIFKQFLGLNMKTFSRLVRINKAIELINNKRNSLNYVCRESGFYDISHFVRDFKTVCGITPQNYRKNMSDFYSEIAKF